MYLPTHVPLDTIACPAVAKVDILWMCISENRDIVNHRHHRPVVAFEAEFPLAL
jgi:hypothetical protein